MSNFDFLQRTKGFERLYKIAVSAENNITIKPAITVMACRKALEITVRWLYKVEDLSLPDTATLIELLKQKDFRFLVGRKVCDELHRLRKEGNRAIHGSPDPKTIPDEITVDDGVWALSRLYLFLDWVDGFYGSHIGGSGFFSSAIETSDGTRVKTNLFPDFNVEQVAPADSVHSNKQGGKLEDGIPAKKDAPATEAPSFWEQMSVVDNVKEAYDWVSNLFGSETKEDAGSATKPEESVEDRSWWDPVQSGIEDAYDWVIGPFRRTVPVKRPSGKRGASRKVMKRKKDDDKPWYERALFK